MDSRCRTVTALIIVSFLLTPINIFSPILTLVSSQPSNPISKEPSRSNSTIQWDSAKQITFANRKDVSEDMDIDSDGNLHLVWVNDTGIIRYGKLDENGTFLAGPKVLGTSDRGWDTNARLDVDDTDRVHITWSNSSGPSGARRFHYTKLDKDGSVVLSKAGSGGDNIIGIGNGFLTIRYYNNTSIGAPQSGPFRFFIYNDNGNETANHTIGSNMNGLEDAAFFRLDNGDLKFVVEQDQLTMAFLTYQWPNGGGVPYYMDMGGHFSSMEMTYDNQGNLHLFYIHDKYNINYEENGIYHAIFDENYQNLISDDYIGLGDFYNAKYYFTRDIAITDSKANDEIAIVTNGYFANSGSGGNEMPETYTFQTITSDGTRKENVGVLRQYCSRPEGDTPVISQSSNDDYFMVWGERACKGDGGDPGAYTENLMFLRSREIPKVDLSITKEDVDLPTWIFEGETFELGFTIRNLKDNVTHPFNVSLEYTDNGSALLKFNDSLGPSGSIQHFGDFNITNQTNLTITIDPIDNLDINISNNRLDLVLLPRTRPNFDITSMNISFSPVRPILGQQVKINAQVTNLGGLDAHVDVVFEGGQSGPIIAIERILSDNYTETVSVLWIPITTGIHNIYVSLVNSSPSEPDRTQDDNHANRTILVGSHSIPTVNILSPEDGAHLAFGDVRINGSAYDPDGDKLEVFLRLDQGDWEPTTMSGPDGNNTWFMNWNLSDASKGNHSLTAMVSDDIHENFTTIDIQLIDPPPPLVLMNWWPKYDPTIDETERIEFSLVALANIDCQLMYQWDLINERTGYHGTYANLSDIDLYFDYEESGDWTVFGEVSCKQYSFEHTWNLTVLDVNRPPKVFAIKTYYSVFLGDNVTINVTAYDLDNDTLTFRWEGEGLAQNETEDPWFTFTPAEEGLIRIYISVSDGRGGFDSLTIQVSVQPAQVIKKPSSKPPKVSSGDNPWWILIVLFGISIIVTMILIYSRYLRKGGKGGGGSKGQDDELSPPGKIA